jgi:6-phosphofructokinase 1
MVAPVSAAWVVGGVYWAGRRDGTTRALAKEVLMSRPRKRIGLLTSGGDCPGINAVIRAVTKTAIVRYGYEVVGFEDGFLGLIEDSHRVLSYDSVSGILATGGTILGTSNDVNPFNFTRTTKGGGGEPSDQTDTIREVYRRHELEALVCVGGDGSMTVAHGLADAGLNVVGVPKTIDNDVLGTDLTFGFDTAVSIITDAIDRLHTTAMSHHRVMVIEVMGRNAGWLALTAGAAGGGDIVLIPEIPYNVETVCNRVAERGRQGRRFSIVVVAEGATERGGQPIIDRHVDGSPEPVRLGGVGRAIVGHVERLTRTDSRVTVLGHLQRGGPPTAADRVLGTVYGRKAVDMVVGGEFGRMACMTDFRIGSVDLSTPAGGQRRVPTDHPLIEAARGVGVSFGDERSEGSG